MESIAQKTRSIYYDHKIVPLFLSAAILIDYSLTFFFAGSISNIMSFENSFLLKYAIENNFVIPYLLGVMAFYYAASYIVLDLFKGQEVYPAGVGIIGLMAVQHIAGGMSWFVNNAIYSYSVISLSMITIVLAMILLGYTIIKNIVKSADPAV